MSWCEPAAAKKWADAQKFGFEVWCDTAHTLSNAYHAGGTRPFPARVTVVLAADGSEMLEYTDGISVGTHPQDVLDDLKQALSPPL